MHSAARQRFAVAGDETFSFMRQRHFAAMRCRDLEPSHPQDRRMCGPGVTVLTWKLGVRLQFCTRSAHCLRIARRISDSFLAGAAAEFNVVMRAVVRGKHSGHVRLVTPATRPVAGRRRGAGPVSVGRFPVVEDIRCYHREYFLVRENIARYFRASEADGARWAGRAPPRRRRTAGRCRARWLLALFLEWQCRLLSCDGCVRNAPFRGFMLTESS